MTKPHTLRNTFTRGTVTMDIYITITVSRDDFVKADAIIDELGTVLKNRIEYICRQQDLLTGDVTEIKTDYPPFGIGYEIIWGWSVKGLPDWLGTGDEENLLDDLLSEKLRELIELYITIIQPEPATV